MGGGGVEGAVSGLHSAPCKAGDAVELTVALASPSVVAHIVPMVVRGAVIGRLLVVVDHVGAICSVVTVVKVIGAGLSDVGCEEYGNEVLHGNLL